MTPDLLLRLTVRPTLAWLATRGVPSDRRAEVMLLAIAGQESGFKHRRQVRGPARGVYQFEPYGGVAGVLTHDASAAHAEAVCRALLVSPGIATVTVALEQNDVLATAFARLLLWTDAKPLPGIGDEAGALGMYLRCWRPGRPHPEAWPAWWAAANAAVAG